MGTWDAHMWATRRQLQILSVVVVGACATSEPESSSPPDWVQERLNKATEEQPPDWVSERLAKKEVTNEPAGTVKKSAAPDGAADDGEPAHHERKATDIGGCINAGDT